LPALPSELPLNCDRRIFDEPKEKHDQLADARIATSLSEEKHTTDRQYSYSYGH
jgi:hypothetical protein